MAKRTMRAGTLIRLIKQAIKEADAADEQAQEDDNVLDHHRFAQVSHLLQEALAEIDAEY